MKIPQLFIKTGQNKFSPVHEPIENKPLYFWDDTLQRIVPAENKLKMVVVENVVYFVSKSGDVSRV